MDDTTVELADRASQELVDAAWRVARELTGSIDAGFPAGGTVLVTDREGEVLRITAGWACTAKERIPTSAATLYDLASLTKVRPTPEERRLTAATELDGDQRLEPGLVWGTVHDGNAWALGGVAGHAGLFGPAADLARFATALLEPASHLVLSAASLAEMTRRQAGEPPDIRGLGWRLDASEWGPWPPGAYWHTGFTGGSLLIAPQAGLAVVSLLGGVHPKRQPDLIGGVRRAIHQELADALA